MAMSERGPAWPRWQAGDEQPVASHEDLLARRREAELEADPDELLASDAADGADFLAGLAAHAEVSIDTPNGGKRILSGAEVAAAICRPLDEEELAAAPAPSTEGELVAERWIGHRPTDGEPLLQEAWRLLGAQRLWFACAKLEEPEHAPTPTASLRERIQELRGVVQALAREIGRHQIPVIRNSDGKMMPRSPGAASDSTEGEAGFVIHRSLSHLVETEAHFRRVLTTTEELERSRRVEAERLAGIVGRHAQHGRLRKEDRGASGFHSAKSRILRYLRAAAPLVVARWSWPQHASLIIDSGRWAHPPCRRFVARLLADTDRDHAIAKLAERMSKTSRRSRTA